MENKNLYLKTTITAVVATIVYAVLIYLLRQEFNWESIIFFAIIFWVIFFLFQKRFEKSKEVVVYKEKEKEGRKEKILGIFEEKEKITNNDVEKLLGVSDATATNYLQELENEGKIKQVGKTGKGVYYISNG